MPVLDLTKKRKKRKVSLLRAGPGRCHSDAGEWPSARFLHDGKPVEVAPLLVDVCGVTRAEVALNTEGAGDRAGLQSGLFHSRPQHLALSAPRGWPKGLGLDKAQ